MSHGKAVDATTKNGLKIKEFGSSKHRKAASALSDIYCTFFCCKDHLPLEQRKKLAARFCPENDAVRKGSIY